MPSEYVAWGWTRGAGLPGLRSIRKALPQPSANQLLIANSVIALNPVDWKMIEWGHDDWRDGHVPGVDGVGVVAAAGSDASIRPGTRVAYHQGLSADGSFAEYSLIDARAALVLPDELDDAVAAALPCPGLTALQALDKLPQAGVGDVLVVGAGGAVGSLLAQMAVKRGMRVWATASAKHHERLLEQGVVGVFDYHRPEWRTELQARLGSRRLSAIFDTVSGRQAANLAELLGYNGHLVCIQDRQETAPLPAFSTAISLHEVALNSLHAHGVEADWQRYQQQGAYLLQQVAQGQLKGSALLPFDFNELPAKLEALRDAEQHGKWIARLQPGQVFA
ncbi:alcohol dehydrogenase catalytic domain-containing protein [Pseudomonas piscis]|uniref:Zinc-binding dehydrogenase n=1 Tax=Pseudomonas piscis TaxID=2614538 RepID=A0A7X1PUF1_9PSED|nr:zinc-binding dehydrogenase [Pseudomonas piscis]MQA57938.1 zinc-binding dehydrogenase [Pseudomonas piscis]